MAIDKELVKGTLPLIVLRLVAGADCYGYQIIKEIEGLSDGVLTFGEGTLYPVLHSLERDGLVSARWGESDAGRRRKYYRATDAGRRDLARRLRDWHDFTTAVDRVVTEEASE